MSKIIEQALHAGKHVLVDDPVTTSVADYCRLVDLAHSQKKHLQDTTMFVYHHAVREFLTCVLDEATFGDITKVDACFDIDSEGARFRGIASDEQRGCIDDLCRYCVVMGLLVFQRSRRKAISVQVRKVERDDQGFPMHCICRIKFEGVSDGRRRSIRCCLRCEPCLT
jgi:predicted dehydrogenase